MRRGTSRYAECPHATLYLLGRRHYASGVAEPGGAGPTGPYPPDVATDEQRVEYDKLRRRVLWKMPSGL
jgi:hypothetical protein